MFWLCVFSVSEASMSSCNLAVECSTIHAICFEGSCECRYGYVPVSGECISSRFNYTKIYNQFVIFLAYDYTRWHFIHKFWPSQVSLKLYNFYSCNNETIQKYIQKYACLNQCKLSCWFFQISYIVKWFVYIIYIYKNSCQWEWLKLTMYEFNIKILSFKNLKLIKIHTLSAIQILSMRFKI